MDITHKLKDLKTQLFDAPTEVKQSFNKVVNYFGTLSEHAKEMKRAIAVPEWYRLEVRLVHDKRMRNNPETFKKLPKDYFVVWGPRFNPYILPELRINDATKIYENGKDKIYNWKIDGIEYYGVASGSKVDYVLVSPSDLKKLMPAY